MDFLTFVTSVIAAVTGCVVARWGWIDRPQHTWRIRCRFSSSEPDRLDIEVHAEGTAIVHEVWVRPRGCELLEPDPSGLRFNRMTAGAEPIKMSVSFSPGAEGDAYVDIRWLRLRPVRQFGERMNLRTYKLERWRWEWRTVRLRRRPGAPWWKRRPVRTGGRWVSHHRPPLVYVPEVD